MNELIKLQPQTINGNAIETASARELHAFLEVGRDFTSWVKGRIEYFVSVSMAKELAMVLACAYHR